MDKPKRSLEQRIKAKLEQLEMQQQQNNIANSFCANCGERLLDEDALWIKIVGGYEDDDIRDTIDESQHFCSQCICVKEVRFKSLKGPSKMS